MGSWQAFDVRCSQSNVGQSLCLEGYFCWAPVFEQESSPSAVIVRSGLALDMTLEHLGGVEDRLRVLQEQNDS